jgi:hypothetical protein
MGGSATEQSTDQVSCCLVSKPRTFDTHYVVNGAE